MAPPPPVDFLGRPLELTLTEEQLAAFGGSPTRALTYPSLEEEAASRSRPRPPNGRRPPSAWRRPRSAASRPDW